MKMCLKDLLAEKRVARLKWALIVFDTVDEETSGIRQRKLQCRFAGHPNIAPERSGVKPTAGRLARELERTLSASGTAFSSARKEHCRVLMVGCPAP